MSNIKEKISALGQITIDLTCIIAPIALSSALVYASYKVLSAIIRKIVNTIKNTIRRVKNAISKKIFTAQDGEQNKYLIFRASELMDKYIKEINAIGISGYVHESKLVDLEDLRKRLDVVNKSIRKNNIKVKNKMNEKRTVIGK